MFISFTMIRYKVKAKLGHNQDTGELDHKIYKEVFENSNPVSARRQAYNHYLSYLEILGDGDPEENLSEHIQKFAEPTPFKIGSRTINYAMNTEGLGVNMYFILDEDHGLLKKGVEYLIIGEQEERSYLTLAENLIAEMNFYNSRGYQTDDWTSKIKYWNYESEEMEEDIVVTEVLFTPFDFWEEWNPEKAEEN